MKENITVNFANNQVKTYPYGTHYWQIVDDQNDQNIIGLRANEELVSLSQIANDNDLIEFITVSSPTGNKIYQAGIKFVLEVALKEEFGPSYEVYFNHSIARGVHIYIEGPNDFTTTDIQRLKNKMDEIIAANEPIQRLNIEKQEAIQYFNIIGQLEKSKNVHNVTNNVVTLYKLKKYINYFYVEMPYSTKYLKHYNLHYIEPNEMALILPNIKDHFTLPPYVHYEKVIRNYKNNKYWLREQNAIFQADINNMVANGSIYELAKSSEMYFNISIQKVVEAIIKRKSKYILIAGPSSSGKTTTTKKIALNLKALGYKPFIISVDDFFHERDKTPKNPDGTYDFESLKAVDTELLSQSLQDLIAGKKVKMPRFDFIKGEKVFEKEVTLPPNSIILMEGLHCLNDELTPSIDSSLKYKIYLSPFMPLNVDRHNYVSSTDIRILRRIIRDKRTRNRSVDQTIAYLDILKNGEEKYIYPFLNQADTIINTALAYEIGVIKVYAEPLLYSIHGDSPYYEEARRLINFLKGFFPIPSEYVNDDSILREFIGGSIFE